MANGTSSHTNDHIAVGKHLLADFYGVEKELLNDISHLEELLGLAVRAAGATVIEGKFHHFGEGGGVTGVLLLQESHISIHTWPETGFAAIDVFMCGQCEPGLSIASLEHHLEPRHIRITECLRGEIR